MGKPIFCAAFPRERRLWATAACFFSLLIRCSTEEAASHDSPHRSFRAAATAPGSAGGGIHRRDRRNLISAHAGGRVPRSLSADGRSYYPMAGTRRRRDRAFGYHPDGSRNEWRPEDGGDAFDFAVRAFRRENDLRRRYGRLFCPPGGVSTFKRGDLSDRRKPYAGGGSEPVG